jgi:nicotinamide-nucleotide adenylyltransferase
MEGEYTMTTEAFDDNMPKMGIFIGRFQPFHEGHLMVIKDALTQCKELIIAIGSAQISHTKDNPFTAGERYSMIREVLKNEKLLDRCHIIPIEDINRNTNYISHVQSFTPEFTIAFGRNPLIERLFKEKIITFRKIPKWAGFKATDIRFKLAISDDWEDVVLPGVVKIIKEIGGTERIRELMLNE